MIFLYFDQLQLFCTKLFFASLPQIPFNQEKMQNLRGWTTLNAEELENQSQSWLAESMKVTCCTKSRNVNPDNFVLILEATDVSKWIIPQKNKETLKNTAIVTSHKNQSWSSHLPTTLVYESKRDKPSFCDELVSHLQVQHLTPTTTLHTILLKVNEYHHQQLWKFEGSRKEYIVRITHHADSDSCDNTLLTAASRTAVCRQRVLYRRASWALLGHGAQTRV